MKGNGRFCNRCKQVGHVEKYCKINKNKLPNVSSIKFDSCYMLVKGANGMKAKFIGTPIMGPKKKSIWVSKILVTNCRCFTTESLPRGYPGQYVQASAYAELDG